MKNYFVYLFSLMFSLLFIACDNRQSSESGTAEQAAPSSQVATSNSQGTASQPAEGSSFAKFAFEETEHDFGQIKHGDVVKHTFKFTNNGDAPLLISDIKTTCGCTTPEYTKDPVAPGEEGEILVQFNSSGKSGVQTKRITIFANIEGGSSALTIKTVVKDKEIVGPYKNQPTR